MYPYMFGGKISSYSVFMVIAIIAAVVLYRFLCAKKKTPDDVYNYYSTAGIVSIAAGILSAFLFQSVYNFFETGVFRLGGLTFMGGLVGGALCFILFAVCSRRPNIRRAFFSQAEIASVCVALAHAIGRIGCFLAGCCYGKESEHGLYFPAIGKKVIPTQLYESVFLFALFAVLLVFTLKDKPKGFNLIVYCFAYSIFRFVIEFFRDDPRGAFLDVLSPSQVQSLVFFACGIALTVLRIKKPELYLFEYRAENNVGALEKSDIENTVTDGDGSSAAAQEKTSPETVSETDLTPSAENPTESVKDGITEKK